MQTVVDDVTTDGVDSYVQTIYLNQPLPFSEGGMEHTLKVACLYNNIYTRPGRISATHQRDHQMAFRGMLRVTMGQVLSQWLRINFDNCLPYVSVSTKM